MAVINPPGYLHNLATHTAQTDRLADTALLIPDAVGSLRPKGGVRMAGDLTVSALGTPNMSVNLSAGSCWVPQGQSNLGGAYNVNNDGTVNLSIAAANASLPRNDLVVARVRDQFYTGTQNVASFEVLTGTAASTPTDPTLPTDSSFLILARVVVPAGATSIINGNITMLAGIVSTLNGINLVGSSDVTPGIYFGQYRDHPTLGLQRWDGSVWTNLINPGTVTELGPLLNGATYKTDATNYPLRATVYNGGQIRLSGAMTNVAAYSASAGTEYFPFSTVLPSALRPTHTLRFIVALTTGTAYSAAVIRLAPDGTFGFVPEGAMSAGFLLHVDGITYANSN